MNKNKHEEEFIESLYDEANEELKEVYKEYKNNRDELLKEIAMVILTYTVIDSVMRLSRKEKDKQYSKLSTLILKAVKGQGAVQEKVIREVLNNTIKNTFNFYSYNADLKDVKGIINKNFKGKHFSKRVWENENEVAKKLHSQVNNFLNGRINVNQIKKDIERTYNTSAYNAKRLVETEVNRCSSNAFDRFCIETGVKKVRYNATLDSKLCSDCGQYHDRVFDFEDKIEVPRHPLCRCFYTIEDDEKKSKVDDEIAVSKDDKDDIISNKKDGASRAEEFSKYWGEASLKEAINKFAKDHEIIERVKTGKTIYKSKSSDIQIVYDNKGNYFRIEDTRLRGSRRYLDLDGNNPTNKIENGKQKGRSKEEYEPLTHFKNKDGEN